MIIVCKGIQICQYNKKTGATKSVAPVLLFTMSDGSDRKKTSITSFNWLISSKIYRKVIHDGKFIPQFTPQSPDIDHRWIVERGYSINI